MALTTEEQADLTAYRTARRKLISGEAVAKVMSGGRTVEFAVADLDRLDKKISDLEAVSAGVPARGRLRFFIR